MAFNYFDRVKETSTTTGTGQISLGGAVASYIAFSSVYSNNDTMYYCITDQTGNNWEVGLGTYVSSGNKLTRTTVLASSNSGSLVNFTSGSLFVFVTIPGAFLNAPTITDPNIIGTTTNDNAATGSVGEYIFSNVTLSGAISLSTGTPSNITSISLTAGDWDVWGTVVYLAANTTSTTAYGGFISSTSNAALPSDAGMGGFALYPAFSNTGINPVFPVGTMRQSLSTTTNIYLEGYGNFSVSTAQAYGFIAARRRR